MSRNGDNLPFECVLVNLTDIPDKLCFSETNIEAAVGILVMKHAFDVDGLKSVVNKLNMLLSKMENEARATLVDKIVLYLGEYIDEDVVEELRMQMSIGQVLGIPTAGDRRRAAERAGLRRGMKRGLQKGMEKGLEKGSIQTLADNATVLRKKGLPESLIAEIQSELEALRQSRLAKK